LHGEILRYRRWMNAIRAPFVLDPRIVYLNHGSFGACPAEVLRRQGELRQRLEANPVAFLTRDLEPLLDAARAALAAFVGASAEDLVFVPNSSSGVNAVLRSLRFAAGDELLTTNHGYAGCRNALDWVAERWGARVVVAEVPFPLDAAERIDAAVLAAVTPRTRLAFLDHVTSPTGLVFPVARLVAALAARGVDTFVDGAHAPGMVDLDVSAIGAAYYSGACHKWLCAPKGAGFLHVRRDRQEGIVPTTVSHGLTAVRSDRSRFQSLFGWIGSFDPSPALCVPAAIEVMGGLLPGGWPALRARNRALALRAREILCTALGVAPPTPDELIGALATVPLPDRPAAPRTIDPLAARLAREVNVEVPVFAWPAPPRRFTRISAQVYNDEAQFVAFAQQLTPRLGGN
jgi:isopenicillin-N epimerase